MRLALKVSLIMGIFLGVISCESADKHARPENLTQSDSERSPEAARAPLSKEQILAITDTVASERGWFPQVRRTYDEGNTLWKLSYGQGRLPPELEGHDYQVVTYVHAHAILDGELVVIVDRNTGAVLKTITF